MTYVYYILAIHMHAYIVYTIHSMKLYAVWYMQYYMYWFHGVCYIWGCRDVIHTTREYTIHTMGSMHYTPIESMKYVPCIVVCNAY